MGVEFIPARLPRFDAHRQAVQIGSMVFSESAEVVVAQLRRQGYSLAALNGFMEVMRETGNVEEALDYVEDTWGTTE